MTSPHLLARAALSYASRTESERWTENFRNEQVELIMLGQCDSRRRHLPRQGPL
jgi:hypothetical protein